MTQYLLRIFTIGAVIGAALYALGHMGIPLDAMICGVIGPTMAAAWLRPPRKMER
jgi:hypothetical protein